MKGLSLNPTKSVRWYCLLISEFKTFNKNRRQDDLPEVDFKFFCYNKGIDLSGRTLVDINMEL